MQHVGHGVHRRGERSTIAAVVAAALAVLTVYVTVLYQLPKGVFLSPDEGGKLLMLHSMEWTRTGIAYHIVYGGQLLDPQYHFYPQLGPADNSFPYPQWATANGRVLFHWQIWFPLLCRTFYDSFGLIGIYLVPLLGGWFLALLSGWLAEQLYPGLAALGILLVGLCTPVFFYSVSFWEHTTASLLGLLAVALCVVRPAVSSAVAAAILIFGGALFRIELVLLGGAVLLGCAASATMAAKTGIADARQRGRRALWFAGPMFLAAALAAGLFYGYLPPRFHVFIGQIPRRLSGLPRQMPFLPQGLTSILINTATEEGPEVPLRWSRLALGALALCLIGAIPRNARLQRLLLGAGLTTLLVFSALLLTSNQNYRSLHGIVPVAPFAALAPYALIAAWRRRDVKSLRLATITVMYLAAGAGALFITFVGPAGTMVTGLEWGQRYLLTFYPMAAVVALVTVADSFRRVHARRDVLVALMGTAALLGALLEIRGVRMLRTDLRAFSDWGDILAANEPAVTDVWWLPTALPQLFATGVLYYVPPGHLGEWAQFATARNIRHFVFARRDDGSAMQSEKVGAYRSAPPQRVREMTFTTFEAVRRDDAAPDNPAAPP